MSAEFDIQTHEPGGGVTVLRVRGRLDAAGVPVLMKRARAVRTARHDLVLNLSGVTFVASSGIGLLLALAEEFQQAGASVRLAEVSPAADSVIRLLNLGEFLSIHPDERSALGESRAA